MDQETKKGRPAGTENAPVILRREKYSYSSEQLQAGARRETMASLIRLVRTRGFPVASAEEIADTVSVEGGALCQTF